MTETKRYGKLTLAPRTGGGAPGTIESGVDKLVVVGANGAGKTRFAAYLSDHTPGAYRISALQALFNQSYTDMSAGSIDSQYAEAFADGINAAVGQSTTQADRLTALMLRREMLLLLQHKLAGEGAPAPEAPSPLDKLIALWQEIFPYNKILIEAGQLLIEHRVQTDRYPALRMSAGERSVLYLIGSVLMAPAGADLFIESPEMFLHPSITQSVWNRIELLRPDCRFIYVTHDLDFAASRTEAPVVWVRNFTPGENSWDYHVFPAGTPIAEEVYSTILGARKPVLFIEGDGIHSIDAKLYPLIFKEYTVKSLGSCNKVIEATRTFNDLNAFHHMDSCGIVDRDRRDAGEVGYLRGKKVMVPEVAEIENILMLEDVIRAVAASCGRNETKVFQKVKRSVIEQFRHDLRGQALLHTRHRVKRIVECRIDGRFANINMLERHLRSLPDEINAIGLYEKFCRDFRRYVESSDYPSVLRVYNQKSMLPASNVAGLCGLKDKTDYVNTILKILSREQEGAERIRRAVKRCFGLLNDDEGNEQ